MASQKDTFINYYDVIGEENKFIARFMSKKEAMVAQKWLNEELFGYEYAKIKVQNVNNNNLGEFKNQYRGGVTHRTAKEFILYTKSKSKLRDNAKFYNCSKDKMAFVKADNFWWKLDTKTPLNKATVYNPFGGKISGVDVQDRQIIEAENWQFLDWTGTDILNDEYQTGWLSPQGKLFGCKSHYHGMQADLVHKKTEYDLEHEGWIKLTYNLSNKNELIAYVCTDKSGRLMPPTDEQYDYLQKCKLQNFSKIKYLYNKKYNDIEL